MLKSTKATLKEIGYHEHMLLHRKYSRCAIYTSLKEACITGYSILCKCFSMKNDFARLNIDEDDEAKLINMLLNVFKAKIVIRRETSINFFWPSNVEFPIDINILLLQNNYIFLFPSIAVFFYNKIYNTPMQTMQEKEIHYKAQTQCLIKIEERIGVESVQKLFLNIHNPDPLVDDHELANVEIGLKQKMRLGYKYKCIKRMIKNSLVLLSAKKCNNCNQVKQPCVEDKLNNSYQCLDCSHALMKAANTDCMLIDFCTLYFKEQIINLDSKELTNTTPLSSSPVLSNRRIKMKT